MTAPAALSPQRLIPLAPASAIVDALRAEHDEMHALYLRHIRVCWAVEVAVWCRACSVLCRAADAAGYRWRLAEERGALADLRVPAAADSPTRSEGAATPTEEVTIDQDTDESIERWRAAHSLGPRTTSNDQRKAAQV